MSVAAPAPSTAALETDTETPWEDSDWVATSSLLTALSLASLHRDFKGNDDMVAAKILDTTLKRTRPDDALADLAQVILARAELAIALGESALLPELLAQVDALPLSDAERTEALQTRQELDALQKWIHRTAP